jgi:hypothetical protein
MFGNPLRNEGTNVLKDISSLNRKSTNAVQYGLASKKPKVINQTYSSIANSLKTASKSTKKPSISNIPKPTGMFYYPAHVPIQLSDDKLNELSARNQVPSTYRPTTNSTKQMNRSALTAQKNPVGTNSRIGRGYIFRSIYS